MKIQLIGNFELLICAKCDIMIDSTVANCEKSSEISPIKVYPDYGLDVGHTEKNMLDKLIALAKEAGALTLGADVGSHFKSKGRHADFVTEYDLRTQEYIVNALSARYPGYGLLCEEKGVNRASVNGYCFIIDPIDGTTNFMHGSSEYAVCIGLAKAGEPILGVVHLPAAGITYFAERGHGAFAEKDGKAVRITVSRSGLDNALIAVGTSPYYPELSRLSLEIVKKSILRAADIRRSGSAAIDICRTAEGVYDIMYEPLLCPWDYTAAGAVLLEAGGTLTDIHGAPIDCMKKSGIVAANPKASAEFIENIKDLTAADKL